MTDLHQDIVRLLDQPDKVANVDELIEKFQDYFKSEGSDYYALMCAAKEQNNPDITKRLGFLTELYFPSEAALIEACKIDISGEACELHPALTDTQLQENWKLYVSKALMQQASKIKIKKTSA